MIATRSFSVWYREAPLVSLSLNLVASQALSGAAPCFPAGVASLIQLHLRPSVTRTLRRGRRLAVQLPPHVEDSLQHRDSRQKRHDVNGYLQRREVSHREDFRKKQANRKNYDPHRP